jgi:hypothetical protein
MYRLDKVSHRISTSGPRDGRCLFSRRDLRSGCPWRLSDDLAKTPPPRQNLGRLMAQRYQQVFGFNLMTMPERCRGMVSRLRVACSLQVCPLCSENPAKIAMHLGSSLQHLGCQCRQQFMSTKHQVDSGFWEGRANLNLDQAYILSINSCVRTFFQRHASRRSARSNICCLCPGPALAAMMTIAVIFIHNT